MCSVTYEILYFTWAQHSVFVFGSGTRAYTIVGTGLYLELVALALPLQRPCTLPTFKMEVPYLLQGLLTCSR